MGPKTSYTDLVIIGAGPAGLMAAAWASRLGLKARILDDKPDRVQNGRADGLHVRTMEILDSFGLATSIEQEAYKLREIRAWNPDPEDENRIRRTQRVLSREEELGRYHQLGIHQGFIEQSFVNLLEKEGCVQVERCIETKSLELDKAIATDPHAYPVTLHLRRGDASNKGSSPDAFANSKQEETIKAKYLLGTDGAHSWTRRQLGLKMTGDRTEKHFGVIDIIPITDFPDARISCSIHSAKNGSVMTFPRESRLVRFYVQLAETSNGGEFDKSKITPDMIVQTASRILSPYKLEYDYCDWWSVYTVGQQYASNFDVDNRVFLAGDAVHTHSPTMGAGMNVSMQDTYNLVWKIGQVVNGIAQPRILSTYNAERQEVAAELMEMDRRMSQFYCEGPSEDAHNYSKFREEFRTFLSGVSVKYGPNILVPPALEKEDGDTTSHVQNSFLKEGKQRPKLWSKQSLGRNMIVGQRLPSHLVMNIAEANTVHVHSMLKSDGRWRVLLLAGDVSQPAQMARLKGVSDYLASPSSFVHTYTPEGEKIDSVIEVLTIHAAPRDKIEFSDLPEILHPFDPKLGHDYWKCFSNNNHGEEGEFSDAYEEWGADKTRGCTVVVRPDQHVSYLCELDEIENVGKYFSQILLPQRQDN
ncbi:Phenol hydroxylase [Exophiala dermatitidis]